MDFEEQITKAIADCESEWETDGFRSGVTIEWSARCEQLMASGNPADIVVKVAKKQFEIYEIKTAGTPRECVRQAIGQLLEYAFWPRSPDVKRLFVVGPVELDSEAREYLQSLIRNFKLPIEYLYQPLED